MAGQDGLEGLKINRSKLGKRSSYGKWALILMLLATVVVAALNWTQWSEKFQGVPVTTAPVSFLDAGGVELSAAGYVVADRMSVLAFKGTGRLKDLFVVEAQEVRKDELVGEIDHHELDAMIAQAKAEVAEAQADAQRMAAMTAHQESEVAMMRTPMETIDAEIAEIKIKLADAKRRYERDKALAEKSAASFIYVEDRETEIKIAQAQIDTALRRKTEAQKKLAMSESQLAADHAAMRMSEAHVKSMAAKIEVLNAQLADAKIYSPFDGVVIEKAAEIGEIVAPISIGGSMARGSIATVAERKSMQAEVDVAEAYIAKVKVGQRAQVLVDAFATMALAGKVLRILPRANRSKATVQVRVAIDDIVNHKEIIPDMGLRVKFLNDSAPKGAETDLSKKLAVPKNALQGPDNAKFLWVVADGKAVKTAVTTGETRDNTVEIKSGLKEGQVVVIKGVEGLKEENQRVRVE